MADQQLERVRKAATATLLAGASKRPPEETPYRRTIVIFIVLMVLLLIALVGVKVMRDTHVQDGSPRAPITKPARH